jgi:hypothetical protein
VKQALLRSVLPDGTVVLLVVLHDDRCAILRNNVIIHEAGGDAEGIDGAVHRFMTMTQVSDVLGGDDAAAPRGADGKPKADGNPAGETSSAATRAELTRVIDSAAAPAPPASSERNTAPGGGGGGGGGARFTPPAASPGRSA